MQLTGEIKIIGQTKHVSDNLSVREFTLIVDKSGAYPQYIQLQMINSRGDILSQYKVGDNIVADVNVKGRMAPTGDKAFNSLEAWKINKAG